jgi:hypothetical protein
VGWIILIAVLLFIFSYLLFASLFIEIDSSAGLYRIRYFGLASRKLYVEDNSLTADFNIIGWHKKIDLFAPKKTVKEKAEKKNKEKKKKKKITYYIRKSLGVIKSFRIKNFRLVIDSGNAVLNGILYPWFYLLGRLSGKTMEINFCNKNELVLKAKSNFARMIWAYLNS